MKTDDKIAIEMKYLSRFSKGKKIVIKKENKCENDSLHFVISNKYVIVELYKIIKINIYKECTNL